MQDILSIFPKHENFEYLKALKRIPKENINQILNDYKEIYKDENIKKFSRENIQRNERIYYKGELNFLLQKCSALNNLKLKATKNIETMQCRNHR